MIHLGVNIDHVATLRQARRGLEPEPIWAAGEALLGGADSITVHLREDRRHIQYRDVQLLRDLLPVKLNLEMAANQQMLKVALQTKPNQVTLVPESRQEITTEGGLNVLLNRSLLQDIIGSLQQAQIAVSLFIDPAPDQIHGSQELQVDTVELHTGSYAQAFAQHQAEAELHRLLEACRTTVAAGLNLYLGHGLDYRNIIPLLDIPKLQEVNIGHSIVSRALFVGMRQAVQEMKTILLRAKTQLGSSEG